MTRRLVLLALGIGAPLSLVGQTAGQTSAARASAVPKQAGMPQAPPQADLRAWKIVSSAQSKDIEARVTTSVLSSAPYFDSVRLEQDNGASKTVCGTFGWPELGDDGVNRYWTYRMPRPTTGACRGTGGGNFVAVGVKSGVESRTAPAP